MWKIDIEPELEYLAIKELEQSLIDEEGNEPKQDFSINDYLPLPNVYRND